MHLQRLIAGAPQDEIFGQQPLDVREPLVDGAAEVGDLLARPHLHGERDGARPRERAVGIAHIEEIQEARRALIVARDLDQVAQVLLVAAAATDEDVADLGLRVQLARRIDGDVLAVDLDVAARHRDVARLQHVAQLIRL